jgi:S-DNA-T family DNA segregation ATPase FtsK/SpoIIIE
VLIDDWDLVAAAPANPVNVLIDLLPQARDVGLHVVITRRSGGAARAMYEPVLGRLRELGTPGLVMSGSPDEGPLVGHVRPRKLPPGRAIYEHRRDGTRMIQLAYQEPMS